MGKLGIFLKKLLDWIAWDDLEDDILEYGENWPKKNYRFLTSLISTFRAFATSVRELKMARNGRTKDIYKGTFICIQTLYCYTVDEAWLAFRYAERASYLALTQYCALD